MKDQTTTPSPGAGHRKRYRHAAAVPEVQSITNAAEAHSQEMHARLVKYATTMGIRMVCIGLIFAFDGWYRLVPMVGAVVLPWIAVVIANGGADTSHQETASLLDEAPRFELSGNPPADGDDFPVVLEGELADNEPGDGVAYNEPGDGAAGETDGATGTERAGKGGPDGGTAGAGTTEETQP